MGHSQRLRLRDVRAVFRLLGEVRDLRRDFDAQQQRIIEGLYSLVGADQGFAVRMDRFSPGHEPHIRSITFPSDASEDLVGYVTAWGQRHVPSGDPIVEHNLHYRKRSGAVSLEHAITPAELRTTAIFEEVLDPADVADVLACFYRRDRWDRMAAYAFHRLGPVPRFEPRSHYIARLFTVELRRLYREGQLEPRPPHSPELTPRQREILPELLAGHAPKQIARKLGISTHTAREYIKDMYRRVGVHGRDELMARYFASPWQ